jgi:hypothetical protein
MAEKFERQFWGGFVDDKLDVREIDTGFGGWGRDGMRPSPALFLSKASARQQYEDVRRVNVSVVTTKKSR